MAKNKNIIFDLDDTLFETARFRREISHIFAKNGVSGYLFQKTYQLSKGGKDYWRPQKQLKLLAKKLPSIKKKKILDQVDFLFRRSKDFLFPDVVQFFKKLIAKRQKHNFKTILITYGNPAVQKLKIQNCCLNKFFDRIIVAATPNKEKEIAKIFVQAGKNGKVIFFEDRGSIIDFLKKRHKKLIAIHIQRPTGRYHEKSLLADFRINNLMAGQKLLKKLILPSNQFNAKTKRSLD